MNGLTIKDDRAAVAAYQTKEVDFHFRGLRLRLSLSHGLFSSADVDSGTRLLLKVVSRFWDTSLKKGASLSRTVLDAGCGIGVMGIAVAKALLAEEKDKDSARQSKSIQIRCQDRDELARAFTTVNAYANDIPEQILQAYTEPLLSCPSESSWDLILSNIPAKAGIPVLRDFVSRSAHLLNPEGCCIVVVVKTLAASFSIWIHEAGLTLLGKEEGTEHQVFVYAPGPDTPKAERDRGKIILDTPHSPYLRGMGEFSMEGIAYTIRAFHGIPDFDQPNLSMVLAAKLTDRIASLPEAQSLHCIPGLPESKATILIHEPAQGHYSTWISGFLKEPRITLSGRNILALEAAKANLPIDIGAHCRVVPAVDPLLGTSRGNYDFVVLFPELVPRTERLLSYWQALEKLLISGAVCIIALPSTAAHRFDHLKPKGFSRMGDLKREGHRALAYRRIS